MDEIVVALPGLFCAGGMVLMMWLMNRSGTSRHSTRLQDYEELTTLRDEVARLRAEREHRRADHDTSMP